MPGRYLLENGVDRFLLEDGSGLLLLEGAATAVARRRGYPELERITAESLYKDLVERYGLYEGRQIYFAMRREQKGPFAEGAKYEDDGKRAQTQASTGIPVKPPEPDRRLADFTREAAEKFRR